MDLDWECWRQPIRVTSVSKLRSLHKIAISLPKTIKDKIARGRIKIALQMLKVSKDKMADQDKDK